MALRFLCSILLLSLHLFSANAFFDHGFGFGFGHDYRGRRRTVRSTCSGLIPVVDDSGPGCSVPDFVDEDEFGNNLRSNGRLVMRANRESTDISIKIERLSRSDLVLTAWFVWVNPNNDEKDEIFDIASTESPVAPSYAAFTSGTGPEPNRLKYTSRSTAFLHASLDFNPTRSDSGPLVGARPSFQSDIPGIEDTDFEQFSANNDDRVIPVSANFLRVFDPDTGFQKLRRGRPELVRSPNPAYGILVVAHIDKTTHGLSAGLDDTDRFEVLFFNLTRS